MTDKEPLKITFDDLDIEAPAAVPEQSRSKMTEEAGKLSQKMAAAMKDAAGKVTAKVTDSTADVAARSAETVREKVSETIQAQSKATADAIEERLRAIDWKTEAQKGTEGGLRWLSRRLDELAERLHPVEPEQSAKDKPPSE